MTDIALAPLGRQEHLTFKGNLKQTRYGWLRLTPAYSVHLVSNLLDELPTPQTRVLDPFCGTGTTALVCAERGVHGQTTDINPFLIWLTRAKTAIYERPEIEAFVDVARNVLEAIGTNDETPEWLPALHQIDKWWEQGSLHALGRAMAEIRKLDAQVPAGTSDLLRVAFCRTLIDRASVSFGHQSMSFKKRKAQEALFGDDGLIVLASESWIASVQLVVKAGRKLTP